MHFPREKMTFFLALDKANAMDVLGLSSENGKDFKGTAFVLQLPVRCRQDEFLPLK